MKSSSSILSFTTSLLKSAASAAFALVLIFVMSVYLLVYGRQIGTLVRRWLPDADVRPDVAAPYAPLETHGSRELRPQTNAEPSLPKGRDETAPEESTAWRQEVAARLNRYQARRKPRPPRYPSLRLRFDEEDHHRTASGIPVESPAFQQRITTVSNQALALDGFADSAAYAVEIPAPTPSALPAESPRPTTPATASTIAPTTGSGPAAAGSWRNHD